MKHGDKVLVHAQDVGNVVGEFVGTTQEEGFPLLIDIGNEVIRVAHHEISLLVPVPPQEPKPRVAPFGLTIKELEDHASDFYKFTLSRLTGVGAEQYHNGAYWKFEEMSVEELVEYAEEEVMDLGNYAMMLYVRIQRIRAALDHANITFPERETIQDHENDGYEEEDSE